MRVVLPVLTLLSLSGCVVASVAETAVDVATLPVKAASGAVDLMTTSQDEADLKAGRELRKQQARERKAAKKAEREARDRDD
jgi:isocitrate lyase